MPRLRNELLRFDRADGGVDFLDPLLERLVSLSPDDARGLTADDPAVIARLEQSFLFDGPMADSLRQMAWSSRAKGRPLPAPAPAAGAFDWDVAASLDDIVAAPWRDGERWRRLAEDRAAGRRYLPLPGLLATAAATQLADAARALVYTPLTTELVHAERHLLAAGELDAWQSFMAAPATRALLGAVLGVELPQKLVVNAWQMRRGDLMGVHPDGRLYRGTLSLGLTPGWTAADGGAIAFGDPTPTGFVPRERWFPHLGDALLFAPAHDTWHAVEPVLGQRLRHSLTGWWTGA
jgi:hypothetical protein